MWLKLRSIYRKNLHTLSKHKKLTILTLINLVIFLILTSVAYANRLQLESYFLRQILTTTQPSTNFLYDTQITPFDLTLHGTYIRDTSQYNQVTLTWPYLDSRDQLDIVFNIDNLYLTLNSRQMIDYLSGFSTTQAQDPFVDNPFFQGESSLHFDKQFLDNLNPEGPSDEQIIESRNLVNQQIVRSLRFRELPKVTKQDRQLLLKIPLKIEYEKLSEVIYPNLKNYLVNNQAILKSILDQTKIDLYLNFSGQLARVVLTLNPLSNDQIESIFADENANTLVALNQQIMDSLNNSSEDIIITTNFTKANDDLSVTPPTNTINLDSLFSGLSFSPLKIAESTLKSQTSKYTINNGYVHKAPSDMIAKDFAMIHNMLYRYYNEHGRYPSTLNALSNSYFPSSVPGNSETGQAFYYTTFDANQGYLLCPTKDSVRNYCFKKFKLNEIN